MARPKAYQGDWTDFDVIPNEQTPEVPPIEDHMLFFGQHAPIFDAFLQFARYNTRAVGLAANQCNLKGERFMSRMFALRNLQTKDFEIIIDPKIKETKGMLRKKLEGCLTWAGNNIVADRHHTVVVEYRDITNTIHTKEVSGFEAQIWQHEINHLNGVEEEIVDRSYRVLEEKYQRNEPCPCGSGKKYKKCCGKN